MYCAHWQLNCRPFENAAGPQFFVPNDSHRAALLKLRFALESNCGAAVLTGASGLGKTLIVQTLLAQLGDNFQPRVRIVFPQMPPEQLLATIADELTGELTTGSPAIRDSLQRIDQVFMDNHAAGRHAVIVIDEAHLLIDAGTLGTLRLLLNKEVAGATPFSLLLVGQSSLLQVLERLPDFEQRVSSCCVLQRFSAEETRAYVEHRLWAAGATHPLFDDHALETLHRLSQGVPRKINRLCDLALMVGYAEDLSCIGSEQVEAIAEELLPAAV